MDGKVANDKNWCFIRTIESLYPCAVNCFECFVNESMSDKYSVSAHHTLSHQYEFKVVCTVLSWFSQARTVH